MKRIKTVSILSILILMISCENQTDDNITIINVDLLNSEIYKNHTGISGDEDGAFISKQATHYEVSEVVRNSTTNWNAIYKYKAQNNYVGEDEVELELRTGSDGASPPKNIDKIRIEFSISD